MGLAARLGDLRSRSKKSLQVVADETKISKAHLWDLERGRSENPTIEVIERLSDFYNVDIAYLVGEKVDAESTTGVLYRKLNDLDERDQKIIEGLIDSMSGK